MLAPPSSSVGKKILEASEAAFLRASMAFLLASTRPSSTKILLVKSLTGPSSLKWILESSVFGSVGTIVLLTETGVAASVVVVVGAVVVVVVVVVGVVVVTVVGTL